MISGILIISDGGQDNARWFEIRGVRSH